MTVKINRKGMRVIKVRRGPSPTKEGKVNDGNDNDHSAEYDEHTRSADQSKDVRQLSNSTNSELDIR